MSSTTELTYKEKLKAVEYEKGLLNSQIKELSEKLRKANGKHNVLRLYHENVMNNVQSGVLIFDRDRNIIVSNSYYDKLVENKKDSSSLRLFKLCLKHGKVSLYDELREVVEKGKVLKLKEVEFNTPSGKFHKLNIKSSPIIINDNIIIGGNLIIEDATEKARLEKELAVSKRFATLGMMSGKVVHELRTPLDGTLRFINLAIRLSSGNHKLEDYLFKSKKGLERMMNVVSSLLDRPKDVSAIQGMFPINGIIMDAVGFLEHIAASRKIQTVFDLDNRVSSIKSEELFQVFSNIVKNSLDAMPDGGELKISSMRKNDNNIIRFSDTGMGIPNNIQHRVFDPFFTNKENGMGLGLAISMSIAQKYGASISIDSKEGKGTTVVISIPVGQ